MMFFYKIGERRILFSSLSTMKAGVDLSLFCAKGESITQIDADKTLASVRRADSGGDISISGNKKIRSLEKEFDTVFGLYAQVCYTNAEGSRYYTSGSKDDMTLAAFNAECEKNGCKKGVSR